MGFLCSELGFLNSAGDPGKGLCMGEGRSAPWEDGWLRSRISEPQQVLGCLLEGRAEPVVDGEPGAGWCWDILGLPCCQNIPTREPHLLSVETQVALFCPALGLSRTLCNCLAL